MKRRQFIKSAGGGLTLAPSVLRAQSAAPLAMRDKYGGCPAVKFDATGFFRLEKRNRWWFVTPEGNAFLSLGMNHVHPGWLNQAYNAEHWLKAFGAERAHDPRWRAGLRAKVIADLNAFGYNTLGVHNSYSQIRPRIETAWIKLLRFIDMAHWREPEEMEFPDVFTEGFEKHCDALAKKECASQKGGSMAARLRDDRLPDLHRDRRRPATDACLWFRARSDAYLATDASQSAADMAGQARLRRLHAQPLQQLDPAFQRGLRNEF